MAVRGISPISPLEITTSWNLQSKKNNIQPPHKHVWKIYTSEHLKVSQLHKKGKKQRYVLWNVAQNNLYDEEEGEITWWFWLIETPNSLAWIIIIFHTAEPSNQGREPGRDHQAQGGNSWVLVTTIAVQKAVSWSLATPQSLPSTLYPPRATIELQKNLCNQN